MEARALKAGPIPKSTAHILFTIDLSLFWGSWICLAFALAFTELRPSTAWSQSSGEASLICLVACCFRPALSLLDSGWSAVAVEVWRTKSNILVAPKGDIKSLLSNPESNLETPNSLCFFRGIKVENSDNSFFTSQLPPTLSSMLEDELLARWLKLDLSSWADAWLCSKPAKNRIKREDRLGRSWRYFRWIKTALEAILSVQHCVVLEQQQHVQGRKIKYQDHLSLANPLTDENSLITHQNQNT